jgi:16S rRNA (uracil1498-N3)-methyltransferase
MPVFFVPPQCITPSSIVVTGDLLIHLRDSLRISIGDTLRMNDGQGTQYRTEITDVSKHTVTGHILEAIPEPPRHTPRLILGQSLLKGEKMDWVIQKATELGVDELVPIESRHSVVHLKADRVSHQLARWQRIALEAAQQSEQWQVPTIASPLPLASLKTDREADTLILLLAERLKGQPLQSVELPRDASGSVLILTGPEGGWSPQEVTTVLQAGVQPITLGPHILRAETAAIAALAIVQSRLGVLG